MKKIDFSGLDMEISRKVAEEFLEYRNSMEKKYHIKTQGQFDRQMKKALKAHEVGMLPDELIEWTMDKNWVGININYTKNALSSEANSLVSASIGSRPIPSLGFIGKGIESTKTKHRTIEQQLEDKSWAN